MAVTSDGISSARTRRARLRSGVARSRSAGVVPDGVVFCFPCLLSWRCFDFQSGVEDLQSDELHSCLSDKSINHVKCRLLRLGSRIMLNGFKNSMFQINSCVKLTIFN